LIVMNSMFAVVGPSVGSISVWFSGVKESKKKFQNKQF